MHQHNQNKKPRIDFDKPHGEKAGPKKRETHVQSLNREPRELNEQELAVIDMVMENDPSPLPRETYIKALRNQIAGTNCKLGDKLHSCVEKEKQRALENETSSELSF